MTDRRFPSISVVPYKLWGLCAVAALTVLALALCVADPVAIQGLRLAQFDQFQRWQPRPYTPTAVRVVDIDEAALKAYGQWP